MKTKIFIALLTPILFLSCKQPSTPEAPADNTTQDVPEKKPNTPEKPPKPVIPGYTITTENPIDIEDAAKNIRKTGLAKNVKLENFTLDGTDCTVYLDSASGIFEAYDETADSSSRSAVTERVGRLIYRGTYIYNNKLTNETSEHNHESQLWFCVTEERNDSGELVAADVKYFSSEVDLGIVNNSFTDTPEIIFTETVTTSIQNETAYIKANETFELISEIYIEEYKENAESALTYTFKILPNPLEDEDLSITEYTLPKARGTFPLELNKEYTDGSSYPTIYVFGEDGIFTKTQYEQDATTIIQTDTYKFSYDDDQLFIIPYRLWIDSEGKTGTFNEAIESVFSMLDEKICYEKQIKPMIDYFTNETGISITSYLGLPDDATEIQIYKAVIDMMIQQQISEGDLPPETTYDDYMTLAFTDFFQFYKISFNRKDCLKVVKRTDIDAFNFQYNIEAYSNDLELFRSIRLVCTPSLDQNPGSKFDCLEINAGLLNFCTIRVKENNSGYSTRTLHSAIITSAENGVIKAYDTYAKKTYEIEYTKKDNDYSLSGEYYNSNKTVRNLCSVFPPKHDLILPKE